MLQPLPVQVSTDQHELVFHRSAPTALIQGEALADEVEDVALVAFLDPEQTLGPKDGVRKALQEVLKLVDREGLVAPERERRETVRRYVVVPVPMVFSCVADIGSTPLVGEIAIGLEQADAQDQRQRDLA